MAGKIQDFGEKIGGAKKDLWSNTALMLSNFDTLTDVERNKYCAKDYVWPRPDWVSCAMRVLTKRCCIGRMKCAKLFPRSL